MSGVTAKVEKPTRSRQWLFPGRKAGLILNHRSGRWFSANSEAKCP
jgi:hypothetical protein